jgi:hypothetical protein
MNLAPIVVFAFNRPKQFKETLESLSNCCKASHSVVYIFIDGPRSSSDSEAVSKVIEVASHFKDSFKKMILSIRERNIGLAKSVIEGITSVLNEYPNVIVLEDDLIVSKDFIIYMNKALDYKYVPEVSSISGFSMDIKYNNSSYDNFFHGRPCSWGWGTWKTRWDVIDWEYKPKSYQERLFLRFKTLKYGQDVFRMYEQNCQLKINSWAILWTIHSVRNNLFTSYPKLSKVVNNGFGKQATHCKSKSPYPALTNPSEELRLNFSDVVKWDVSSRFKFNFYYSNVYKIIFKTYTFLLSNR